jgi:hypothetical protein
MLKGFLFWALLLAASFGCASSVRAGDGRESSRAEPAIEIKQRAIDSERSDESTIIEVRIINRSSQSVADVTLHGDEPNGYRLRAASAMPVRNQNQLVWALGTLRSGEERTLRLQWEMLPNVFDVPLKCALRASYRGLADSAAEFPAKRSSVRIDFALPETATVGVPLALRIDVLNTSGKPLRGVVLQASFADGLSHALGKELENALGTIEAGMTRTIPLELIPTRSGDLRGKVRLQLGAGAAAEREFVVRAVETGLALAVAVPPRCAWKEAAPLAFTIQNNGKDIKRRVRLVVRFAKGLGFVAASDGGASVADGCAYWDLGDLKPGQSRLVRLDTEARMAGEQKITAVLSADGREAQTHSVLLQVEGPAAYDPNRRP